MRTIEWPKFGFLGLLICLVLLLVVTPFLEEFSPAQPVLTVFSTAVLLFSLYSFLHNKRVLVIASLLAAPAFIFNWVSYLFDTPFIPLIKYVFNSIFFIYIVVSILSEIVKKNVITLDLIYGSICVYLLIGVAWAFVYATVEHIFPGSYNLPLNYMQANPSLNVSEAQLSLFLYYSYVTLTTLGYGDITPVTPPAHSLAILEAIMGQFYIAILVARLVGIYASKKYQP
jgi:voltage-gated potassium channel